MRVNLEREARLALRNAETEFNREKKDTLRMAEWLAESHLAYLRLDLGPVGLLILRFGLA